MTDSSTSVVAAPDPAAETAVAVALAALAGSGSFFTGAERLAIASQVRFARGLTTSASELAPVLAEHSARVAVEAITVRPEHVDAWQADGRDVLAYVELVAIVALITSIDSYRVGIGAPLDPFPDPTPGAPTPAIGDGAVKSNAWVPTVGIALAPTALSALPNEKAHKDAISKVWYLTDEYVHKYDVEPGRELTRPQMELVASRTSWLNECFF